MIEFVFECEININYKIVIKSFVKSDAPLKNDGFMIPYYRYK